MSATKLIWVDEKFGEQYEALKSDEEKYKAFEEYLATVSEKSKQEFKSNFETLEEDVAIYTGLMLKVKQAFEKAKNEQLTASYALWENFEKEMPSIHDNIENIVRVLDPLETRLNTINEKLGKIQSYNVDKLLETISKFDNLYGRSKEMFEFVVKNFNQSQ